MKKPTGDAIALSYSGKRLIPRSVDMLVDFITVIPTITTSMAQIVPNPAIKRPRMPKLKPF